MPGSTYLSAESPKAFTEALEKPKRLDWPDNGRALAAVMICFAHFVGPFRDPGDVWSVLWVLTWPLRLPVLIVLAGYFSSSRYSSKNLRSVLLNLLGVFVIFTLLHALLDLWIKGSFNFKVLDPYMGLWFLLSLALWRLTLPLVVRVPGILAISVLAALAIGLAPAQVEAWPVVRTFTLWPLFLLGVKLKSNPEWLSALRRRSSRIIGGTFLTLWLALVLANIGHLRAKPLALDAVFTTAGEGLMRDLSLRLGIILSALILALSVLSVMPDKKIKYVTSIGIGSFTVYLLHPLLFRVVNHVGLYEWANQWWQVLAVALASIALAAILASAPVRRVAKPFIYPPWPRAWRGG